MESYRVMNHVVGAAVVVSSAVLYNTGLDWGLQSALFFRLTNDAWRKISMNNVHMFA